MKRIDFIKPGTFSVQVAADSRRLEFDMKNEVVITNNVPVDFVFIGDSITHLWELDAYFGKKNCLILNRGIGGDTSEYVLKRFAADVLQLKPRYCVMHIGINDSWVMEPDIWKENEGESIEFVEERVKNNLTQIVDLSLKNSQKLILCSILPTKVITEQRCSERNEYIIKVNSYMKELCKDKGCIYVDYHLNFVKSDGITIKNGLIMEGLHPHVYGYNVMADVLRTTLAQNGIEI